MSLTKVNYIDNETIITAKNLNDIQDNIIELDNNIKNIKFKAGFIYPLATSVVPEGFLLCDGKAYLRNEYPELFDAIGTIYGSGNGSTTFNVPNLQTRVPVGKGEGYELGDVGGEATHTLTVNEMPSHSHATAKNGILTNGQGTEFGQYATYQSEGSITAGKYWTAETLKTGSSQSHNNMQPYTVVNYIIATGKNTSVSVQDIITGVHTLPLGVEYGGTGATNTEDALNNLGAVSKSQVVNNFTTTEEGFVADARALTQLYNMIKDINILMDGTGTETSMTLRITKNNGGYKISIFIFGTWNNLPTLGMITFGSQESVCYAYVQYYEYGKIKTVDLNPSIISKDGNIITIQLNNIATWSTIFFFSWSVEIERIS